MVEIQRKDALSESLPLFRMTAGEKGKLEEGQGLLGRQTANNSYGKFDF